MTDFETWWLDHKDCYFDIPVKGEPIKNGRMLEFFKIVECVELPDKDIWLGFKCCWIENKDIKISEETIYFRLSEINLVDYTELFLEELKELEELAD